MKQQGQTQLSLAFIMAMTLLSACSDPVGKSPDTTCNQQWYEEVDRTISGGEMQGHGPNLGSSE